jgi:hypothetical protein
MVVSPDEKELVNSFDGKFEEMQLAFNFPALGTCKSIRCFLFRETSFFGFRYTIGRIRCFKETMENLRQNIAGRGSQTNHRRLSQTGHRLVANWSQTCRKPVTD